MAGSSEESTPGDVGGLRGDSEERREVGRCLQVGQGGNSRITSLAMPLGTDTCVRSPGPPTWFQSQLPAVCSMRDHTWRVLL